MNMGRRGRRCDKTFDDGGGSGLGSRCQRRRPNHLHAITGRPIFTVTLTSQTRAQSLPEFINSVNRVAKKRRGSTQDGYIVPATYTTTSER